MAQTLPVVCQTCDSESMLLPEPLIMGLPFWEAWKIRMGWGLRSSMETLSEKSSFCPSTVATGRGKEGPTESSPVTIRALQSVSSCWSLHLRPVLICPLSLHVLITLGILIYRFFPCFRTIISGHPRCPSKGLGMWLRGPSWHIQDSGFDPQQFQINKQKSI